MHTQEFVLKCIIIIQVILIACIIFKRYINNVNKSNDDTNDFIEQFVADIIKKEDIVYVHIGKTGGSTLNNIFNFNEVHMNPVKYINGKKYIISIRNPINRFVSAFEMWNKIISTMNTIDINNVNIDNDVGDKGMYKLAKQGKYVTNEYIELIKYFNNPNSLAESLTSTDVKRQEKAKKLMSLNIEHINKGLGYYLNNGKFIENHYNDILYIAKQETLDNDIRNISSLLNITLPTYKNKRMNKTKKTYLSEKAIANIIEYYKDTDYKALEIMLKYNLITRKYYDYCFTYNSKYIE